MKKNRALEKELMEMRPLKKEKRTKALFETEENWKKHWWGMPAFEQENRSAACQLILNFASRDDADEFVEKTGIRMSTKRTTSAWYPDQPRLPSGVYCYTGPKTDSKYPVCIPSKGRADCQITGKILDGMGISYKFFVEETEYDEYVKHLGKKNVVKLPFHDLGKGSVPARNFIWRWTKKRGHKRHWIMDDNITQLGRTSFNRKLLCYGGGWLRAMEDFVDRYENIPMAGPHGRQFIPDREKRPAILFNTRIYSCILLDNSMYPKFKWRGRYNEDTDLSLRFLKAGYCTCIFNAFWIGKYSTSQGGGEGEKGLKGGNTDNVYNTGDHRKAFAESLKKQHPDVVKVKWRYDRWHHSVNYRPFMKNKPILRKDVTPLAMENDYGMKLTKRKKKKKVKLKRKKK